jgi:histidinol-phosphatase (PHP family)
MGEPHIFAREAAVVLSTGEFDFVLGSVHYAVGMRHTWVPSYFEQSLDRAFEAYFHQVVGLAAEGDFDVLGHLDLVKRDARDFGLPYNGPERYADLIRTALRSVIQRGKGIELNTSPLRRGQPDMCPSPQILRWYRELGGEILTLGSDAHKPGDVGASLGAALDIARSAGFKRLATFEKRQLGWVKI